MDTTTKENSMAMRWGLATALQSDKDRIEELLTSGWEPFSAAKEVLYFKQHFFSEDDEPKSSTKPENLIQEVH